LIRASPAHSHSVPNLSFVARGLGAVGMDPADTDYHPNSLLEMIPSGNCRTQSFDPQPLFFSKMRRFNFITD